MRSQVFPKGGPKRASFHREDVHVIGSGLGSPRPTYPFTLQLPRVITNEGSCQGLCSLRRRGAEGKSLRESPRSPCLDSHSMSGHSLGYTCATEAAVPH